MEAKTIPRVSVLIDTYNHERFIERAIASVLEQDMPMDGVEIVVVDDGSTDRTPELVRRFEPRVRLIRKPNGGQASAFNAGIPECRGEIIAFLDGDDWWAPGKLRRVVELMAADPSLGIVGHAIIESPEGGAERIIALGAPERLRLDTVQAAKAFRLHRCFFGTSRMTLRGDIAQKILPVPEALVFEADEYMFTLANALSDGFILTEPLTYYRVHAGNLFLNSGGNRDGERRKMQVIASLVAELRRALPACGMPDEVADPILELVQAEAAQLRLKLNGGSNWQTYRVEGTIYGIQHGDASWLQRLFHEAMMLPALVLPPRLFYAARQWLTSRPWYKQGRAEFIPVPGFTHIHASEPGPNIRSGAQIMSDASDPREITLSAHRDYYNAGGYDDDRLAWTLSTFLSDIKPEKVLEVGCGNGAMLNLLAPKGIDSVGVDASSSGISLCQNRGLHAQCLDISTDGLPFPNDVFDVVISLETLEHLMNPHYALMEVRRVLRLRGRFICSVPNPRTGHPYLYPGLFEFAHFRRFLLQNDLSIEQVAPWQWAPRESILPASLRKNSLLRGRLVAGGIRYAIEKTYLAVGAFPAFSYWLWTFKCRNDKFSEPGIFREVSEQTRPGATKHFSISKCVGTRIQT